MGNELKHRKLAGLIAAVAPSYLEDLFHSGVPYTSYIP